MAVSPGASWPFVILSEAKDLKASGATGSPQDGVWSAKNEP